MVQVTDANGQKTKLGYDAYGRRITVTLPLDTANTQEFYYYNAERPARVLSRQLTSGSTYLESHQLVDGFGRGLQSQVNDTTSGYRLVTASALNGLGQARYTSGSFQASGLAGTGYVTPTWASIPIYTAASYDALGRQTVAEARSFTTTIYSSTLSYQGWKTIATDANGKPSAREADAFGQLITVTEYLSNATISQATTYAYDFQGNLVKLVDALGNTTTITYDLLGRKLGMRDPDMGVWGYQYDGNNNLTRQTDARGQQIQFLFDALNRPIEARDANVSWTLEKRYYDEAGYGQSKGRRTRAEAYVGNALNNTIASTYDGRGRVTLDRRSIGGTNYDTTFGYDSANRVTVYRYPSQESDVLQGYNALGQPYSLCQSLDIQGSAANGGSNRAPPKDICDSYVFAATYNALGKPTEIQLGNGLSQRTNYFGVDTPTWFGPGQFGRVRQICVVATTAGNCYDDTRTGGTTATKLNLVYWFDALGNLTAMGDRSAGYTVGGAGQTAHSYGYDDLNRLVSGSATGGEFPNFSSSWGFDGLGNMTYKAGMTQGYPASGPSSVRPHAVITSSNAYNGNYGYDSNGNMTARMDASVTYTLSWDAQNRLGSVTASGQASAWTYDADGARAIKVSGPITTVYIGGSVEVQISGTMRLTTTYYFFGGARIAMRVGETVTYLHGDRLGSASLATDAAGNVLSQERYYVWGSASMMSGTMPTDFQWQNQRRLDDSQTGKLYDFNARFFTPVAARFISPDSIVPNPADPQSLNHYTAMANNPLKFTDPSGHSEACDDGPCHSGGGDGSGYTSGGGSSGGGYSGGGFIGPVARPPAPVWGNPYRPNVFGFSVVPRQTAAQRAATNWQANLNSWSVSGKSAELPKKTPSVDPLHKSRSRCVLSPAEYCNYRVITVSLKIVVLQFAWTTDDVPVNVISVGVGADIMNGSVSFMEGSIRNGKYLTGFEVGDYLSGYGQNTAGSLVVSAAEQRSFDVLRVGRTNWNIPDPSKVPPIADEKGIATPHLSVSWTAALVRWRFDGLPATFLPGVTRRGGDVGQ